MAPSRVAGNKKGKRLSQVDAVGICWNAYTGGVPTNFLYSNQLKNPNCECITFTVALSTGKEAMWAL